jgi:hypothetical protein
MPDKPVAMVYIDDRGMRLVGNCHKSNWPDIVEELLSGPTRPKTPRPWRWWR